jgi:hypothetical protein
MIGDHDFDARLNEAFEDDAKQRREPKPESSKPNGHATHGLGEWNASNDVDKPPPRGWLLGNSFCRGFVSSLLAAGGVGKTATRVLQAISFVTGRELTGEHVFQRGRALIVSFEDDADELRRRILAARLHYAIEPSKLEGLFLAAPGASAGKLMTINPKTGARSVGALVANIEAAILQHRIDLVVLDPFVKAHGVPENANTDMDEVAQLLTDLAAKHNIAVDAPHHVSKGTPEPGNADRGRGASATRDAARLVYTLTQMSPEEAQTYNIAEHDRRDYVRYDRAKLNIARTSGTTTWFKLAGVRLDNANEIYPNGDEVQTLEPWSPPETWADLNNDALNQVLSVIDAGIADGNYYSDANAAGDRAAWRAVQQVAPCKSEPQCREIIRTWVETEVLKHIDYENPATRKMVKGLRVDSTKRPG